MTDTPPADPPPPDTPPASREPVGREPASSEPSPPAAKRRVSKDPLRGSRTSGVWVAVVGLVLLLILLVIFITQNTQDVNVAFLGWDGQAPLSVALLIAAATGLALAAIAGTLRIWQLRRRVRRER